MKSIDEGRHRNIEKAEELLRQGITKDPKTNRPINLPEEDQPVTLEPEDYFWQMIESEMSAAIPPEGSIPVPSEEQIIFNRLGIRHPENQRFVRDTLGFMWAGRAEGLNDKIDKS